MSYFAYLRQLALNAGNQPADTVVLIGRKDNATSLRVKGPQSPNEGVADVQSYSGIFYNVGYADTGTLETRVIHGANVEMDMEIQGPHQVRIVAVDGGFADGQVFISSRTNTVFNMQADAEVASPAQLIVDRVDKVLKGAANTSNVELSVTTGELVFASVPVLPTYLTTGLPPVVAGGMIFVSDAAGGAGRIAYGNTAAAAWIDPETGVAVSI